MASDSEQIAEVEAMFAAKASPYPSNTGIGQPSSLALPVQAVTHSGLTCSTSAPAKWYFQTLGRGHQNY